MDDKMLRGAVEKILTGICTACEEENLSPIVATVAIGVAVGAVIKSLVGDADQPAARNTVVAGIDGILSGEFLDIAGGPK